MIDVLIFTDRSPEQRHRWGKKLNSIRYGYSAGPYKIASILRQMGLKVLVVSSCFNLSFAAIKKIITKHKDSLLWVGISTTLMQMISKDYEGYRTQWKETTNDFADVSLLYGEILYSFKGAKFEMPWHQNEIWLLSEFLDSINIPLILGGSNITNHLNGGIQKIHKNTFFVRGNAEQWVRDYTSSKIKNRQLQPPYENNNSEYDAVEFKNSKILWTEDDLIEPDDWLPIEVARGCAFNCAYCTYEHKGKFDLYKNPKVLYEELIKNYETFGTTKYLIIDDLYNDSKEKVRVLYDEVWSKLPFRAEWTSYMRLDMFWTDPESAEIILASGARCGVFGIETLHSVAGKKVGKGLGKTRILETLTHLKKTWGDEIIISGNFVAGLPDEPVESIIETLEWSINSDLMHTVSWMPLFIASPHLLSKKTNISKIDADNAKYQFTWIDGEWKNNVGVTFSIADQLISDYYENKYKKYRIHHGNYCDLRNLGLSHSNIVEITSTDIEKLPLNYWGDLIESKVEKRLLKILNF